MLTDKEEMDIIRLIGIAMRAPLNEKARIAITEAHKILENDFKQSLPMPECKPPREEKQEKPTHIEIKNEDGFVKIIPLTDYLSVEKRTDPSNNIKREFNFLICLNYMDIIKKINISFKEKENRDKQYNKIRQALVIPSSSLMTQKEIDVIMAEISKSDSDVGERNEK